MMRETLSLLVPIKMMVWLEMQDMQGYIDTMEQLGTNWVEISKGMPQVIILDGMFPLMEMETSSLFLHKTTATNIRRVDSSGSTVLMESDGIKLEPICMVIVTMPIMDIQLI